MKILLVDISTTGHRIEYATYLTKGFTEAGHEVYFITCGDENRTQQLKDLCSKIVMYRDEPFEGGSLFDWMKLEFNLYRYYRTIFAKADSWDIDIIHLLFLENSEIPLFPTLLFERKADHQFYATLFNPRYDIQGEALTVQIFRLVRKLVTTAMVKAKIVDGVFVHTEDMKQELCRELNLKKDAVFSVPDPVTPIRRDMDRVEARDFLQLPKDRSLFLFFGATRYDKGADILLETVDNIDFSDVSVIFAGPSETIGYEDLSKSHTTKDNCCQVIGRFCFIPEDEVEFYFLAADAVVLPYRSKYEGTSGILQRAIAAGRPVIGTDTGQIGSIIRNWGVGVIVPPDSSKAIAHAVETYLENKDELDENAVLKAPEFENRHHWRNLSKKVLSVYSSKNPNHRRSKYSEDQ